MLSDKNKNIRSIIKSLALIAASLFICSTYKVIYSTIHGELKTSSYTTNTIDGMHMSLYTDLREPFGTRSNLNGYGLYLAHVLQILGPRPNGSTLTVEVPGPEWIDAANRQHVPVIPTTDDEYLLGVQRTVRIKILDIFHFPKELIGAWATLTAVDGTQEQATIISAKNDEIVVAGSLPVNFFPVTITVKKVLAHAGNKITLVSTTAMASTIRGGLVAGSHGKGVHLFEPYWAKNLSFNPAPGDTLVFGNGARRRISSSDKILGLGFIVQVEGDPLEPYFFNRADIVHDIAIERSIPEDVELRVKTISNAEFLNGRQRFLQIHANAPKDLSLGSVMALDFGGGAYVVSRKAPGLIEFDLLRSLAVQTCLGLITTGQAETFSKATSGNSGEKDSTFNSVKACTTPDSKAVTFLMEKISAWQEQSPAIRSVLYNSIYNFKQISAAEIWYRNLSLDLIYSHPPEEDTVAAITPKYGSVWEVYPGSMLNVLYGTQNPAPTELLIHALSQDERMQYYKAFEEKAPAYFSFVTPRAFTPWLVNWHWPLFKQVLAHYNVRYTSTDFSFWAREPNVGFTESNPVSMQAAFPAQLPPVADDSACYKLQEVTVGYTIRNPLQHIPVIGLSHRYLISITGINTDLQPSTPISLPPTSGSFSFPVFSARGDRPTLVFRKMGPLAGLSDIRINSLSVRNIKAGTDALKSMFLESQGPQEIADNAVGCTQSATH